MTDPALFFILYFLLGEGKGLKPLVSSEQKGRLLHEDLSREELHRLVQAYAKSWLAHDGCWFLAVEEERGLEEATRCIFCPPDELPAGVFCSWEFRIAEEERQGV